MDADSKMPYGLITLGWSSACSTFISCLISRVVRESFDLQLFTAHTFPVCRHAALRTMLLPPSPRLASTSKRRAKLSRASKPFGITSVRLGFVDSELPRFP